MKKAYAPYSNFLVGAAIQDENGKIHEGINVENSAYPSGTCAEESAISQMIGRLRQLRLNIKKIYCDEESSIKKIDEIDWASWWT